MTRRSLPLLLRWVIPRAPAGEERVLAAFEAAKAEGRAALMPYMMGCFPDHETSLRDR